MHDGQEQHRSTRRFQQEAFRRTGSEAREFVAPASWELNPVVSIAPTGAITHPPCR